MDGYLADWLGVNDALRQTLRDELTQAANP